MSEEQNAARLLGDMLTSALLSAYNEKRRSLYVWERESLQWLLREYIPLAYVPGGVI